MKTIVIHADQLEIISTNVPKCAAKLHYTLKESERLNSGFVRDLLDIAIDAEIPFTFTEHSILSNNAKRLSLAIPSDRIDIILTIHNKYEMITGKEFDQLWQHFEIHSRRHQHS